jgi:hypothetical protein
VIVQKAPLILDRETLAAANICPDTGLATDYLNHFNEVAMLIQMLPDMPEASQEILDWRPRDYVSHFTVTGFRAKELAAAAYAAADSHLLMRFEEACAHAEAGIAEVQMRIDADEDPDSFAFSAASDIFDRIARIGAVILGEETATVADEQAAIDALFD